MQKENQRSGWFIEVEATLQRGAIKTKQEAKRLDALYIVAEDVDAWKDIKETELEQEDWEW
jgi:hypothetical protein